jgi:hypothetical protein
MQFDGKTDVDEAKNGVLCRLQIAQTNSEYCANQQ